MEHSLGRSSKEEFAGILLPTGQWVIVDLPDYRLINGKPIGIKREPKRKTDYVRVTLWSKRIGQKDGRILLHRYLLNAKAGEEVDHKNHDGLDNRRSNIRIATHAQNLWNQHKPRLTAVKPCKYQSQYKGVSWHHIGKCWRARIGERHLGLFKTEVEAAQAWDNEAKKLHGDFAKLNFPCPFTS